MSTTYRFPTALRAARLEAKMSMRQLSVAIFKSYEYIAVLERGRSIMPTKAIATRIARAISSHAKHTKLVSAKLESDLVEYSRQDAITNAMRRWNL